MQVLMLKQKMMVAVALFLTTGCAIQLSRCPKI